MVLGTAFSPNRTGYRLGNAGSLLVGLLIAGHAIAEPVFVSDQASKRAGIAIATLHTARMARSVPALGVVLDPAPLIGLSGELATDKAELAAAKAKVVLERQQMAQARALYRRQTTPLANYQKAQEDLAANEALLGVAQAKRDARLARTEATWGTAMAAALRKASDPLPQLAVGKAMLVALSLPPGTTLAAPPRRTKGEAAATAFSLRLIGPVPGMLGRYPGQSFLYWGTAQPGVPVGITVSASLATGPDHAGMLVPQSAVVWQDGRALVFRARAGHRFEPVPIATDVPAVGGYIVSKGLSPYDRVVVRGADLLLNLAKDTTKPGRKK